MKRDSETEKPVVVVRKKVGKGSTPAGPTEAKPRQALPVDKKETPADPLQPFPLPQEPILPQAPAAAAIAATDPTKKGGEKQARRELLETLRDRWPQAFPLDFQKVRPLALGIRQDIAVHLPQQPLGRVGAAIGLFQHLMGPAYYRAVLQGGPRYDLEGNPR